ncbi:MAG: modification methylase [Ignavibacteria bacterium GWB2_35_12]|nr:MAG: modification methylase [Ignavibacteria bacterium GWA2_35_8]OGU40024.1 MAG: modification methylase [Ignavibacteria bacterium GWB2_35_12]OGU86920.1 MAG: modification methylase [Ignavibacteria bacterium RIFOXYA2_FULL_35_10]OGV21962.1 MAG: modification methylase [Ignavibacteria bacterium RIFOXYC2_FULL_35_21]
MPNKSHFNKGHIAINIQRKNGVRHSSDIDFNLHKVEKTIHAIFINDAVEVLRQIPDSSIQLVLIDPPYNLDLDYWDTFENYLKWAKTWVDEIYRILSNSGNCIIFGGFQYQDLKKGDLLEILHYTRHSTHLRFVNLIIWYYKNGMSAHRFFANRHEEAIWLSKTEKYYFNLDSVRIPFDDETKILYKKDKRLNPRSIDKGKNPTNVWEFNRLNGNSKERVGHPTQKPVEIIRRFIRGLSYPGSTVLDFFAGSGTTGRVCIEEARNSILVDIDPKLNDYLKLHLSQIEGNFFVKPYTILKNITVGEVFNSFAKLIN